MKSIMLKNYVLASTIKVILIYYIARVLNVRHPKSSKKIASLPLIPSYYGNIQICMSPDRGRNTNNCIPHIKVTKFHLFIF